MYFRIPNSPYITYQKKKKTKPLSMVLKTGTVKEPKNVLIIGFMIGPRSDRWSNR